MTVKNIKSTKNIKATRQIDYLNYSSFFTLNKLTVCLATCVLPVALSACGANNKSQDTQNQTASSHTNDSMQTKVSKVGTTTAEAQTTNQQTNHHSQSDKAHKTHTHDEELKDKPETLAQPKTSTSSSIFTLKANQEAIFTGKIDGNINIKLTLQRHKNVLSGYLWYGKNSKKPAIRLIGFVDSDNSFVFDEFSANGNITGTFSGNFAMDDTQTPTGKWFDPKKQQSLSLSLTHQKTVNKKPDWLGKVDNLNGTYGYQYARIRSGSISLQTNMQKNADGSTEAMTEVDFYSSLGTPVQSETEFNTTEIGIKNAFAINVPDTQNCQLNVEHFADFITVSTADSCQSDSLEIDADGVYYKLPAVKKAANTKQDTKPDTKQGTTQNAASKPQSNAKKTDLDKAPQVDEVALSMEPEQSLAIVKNFTEVAGKHYVTVDFVQYIEPSDTSEGGIKNVNQKLRTYELVLPAYPDCADEDNRRIDSLKTEWESLQADEPLYQIGALEGKVTDFYLSCAG